MEESNVGIPTVELTADQFRERAQMCGWQSRTIELMIKPMLGNKHFGGSFAMGEKGGPFGRMFIIIKPPV